jgi:hypothetical protein
MWGGGIKETKEGNYFINLSSLAEKAPVIWPR